MSKIALVTGGAKGIGAEICRALAKDGWDLRINYHTSEAAAQALAEETGGMAIQADVREFLQVSEMFRVAGPVDLLVNNAGIAAYGLFTETSIRLWRELFAVNVDGVFHCTQCALPHMIRAKRGVIVNIASVWGMVGASCEAPYATTKAAVIGLTKSLAKELGPSGIRVNCVAPGAVDTDMVGDLSPADLAELIGETPLRTIGRPADIAPLVAFLASDQAQFLTGQVISPNGGLVI
ncbi:MAG: 3-oxoacyl-ACP reductase FabG [Oscillospiraceae bacterium]|nr:3-oxoacyl-ACP reductase FabG [Oscillospiraceae bacterium]